MTAHMAGPDDTDIDAAVESVTNVDEIKELIDRLKAQEDVNNTMLDHSLKDIGPEDNDVEDSNQTLINYLNPKITSISHDAMKLYNVIQDTAILANKISEKIRTLDLAQVRCKDTLNQLNNVQHLKDCLTGIQNSLAVKALDTAASYFVRLRSLDPEVTSVLLTDSILFTSLTSPGGTNSSASHNFRRCKEQCTSLIRQEYHDAVAQQNYQGILRCIKLWGDLDEGYIAVAEFSKWISNSLINTSRDFLRDTPTTSPTAFADILTHLYESFASTVDSQCSVIESHLGYGEMLDFLRIIGSSVFKQAGSTLDTMLDQRHLNRKLREVHTFAWKAVSFKRTSAEDRSDSAVAFDMKEIDSILAEMSLISQRSKICLRFFRNRIQTEMVKLKENPKKFKEWWQKQDHILVKDNGEPVDNYIEKRCQEIIGYYVALEEFYVRKSLLKAMQIDDHEGLPALTSSCVDDTFFILKKSINRAISCRDFDCVCAMINLIYRLLEDDFLKSLLSELVSKMENDILVVEDTNSHANRFAFIILLNNLDVSSDYISKLVSEVSTDVSERLTGEESEDGKRNQLLVNSCLATLEDLANIFKQNLKKFIGVFFEHVLKKKWKVVLKNAFKDVKYILADEEYAEAQESKDLLFRLSEGMNSTILAPYKPILTENNLYQIIAYLAEWMTKEWEKLVLNSKFNQLGSLRLDKDLRSTSAYFGGLTSWSVRDKFTRLSQISLILNMEKIDEIYEHIKAHPTDLGSGSRSTTRASFSGTSKNSAWKLTALETKKVLTIRFGPKEASAIVFNE